MTVSAPAAADPSATEWPVWTTTARLVVTDPCVLTRARALVVDHLARVERAASRFRPDSEVSQLARTGAGRPVAVSPLLAELVGAALAAAARTGGDVDPTVGAALVDLGYDRDLAGVATPRAPSGGPVRPAHSWRDVDLQGEVLTVPPGVLLDLGATAKAHAADRCATTLAARFGCGVLVSLGGDLRVAGPPPEGGWQVLVQDGADQPASTIRLDGARAVATSSTLHRTWQAGARRLHHIIDPSSGRPAAPVWRTVSVAAATCVRANTLTTAAVVRGHRGLDLLTSTGLPARLVAADGTVVHRGGWPV